MSVSVEHPTDRPNFYIVGTPNARIGFSYQTAIAVYPYQEVCGRRGHRWYTAINEWGPTTGKHLNYFDDGDRNDRYPLDSIDEMISACFKNNEEDEK